MPSIIIHDQYYHTLNLRQAAVAVAAAVVVVVQITTIYGDVAALKPLEG
jgi:hypothetical protein